MSSRRRETYDEKREGAFVVLRSSFLGRAGAAQIIARNKASFEKTRGAYARTAAFYSILAIVFLIGGLMDWRGVAWVLTPAGIIFGLAAILHYSTGRRFGRE